MSTRMPKISANWLIEKVAARIDQEPSIETQPGYCLRAVRQVVEIALGESAWPVPRGLDAKEACKWFREHGYVVSKRRGSKPGDLLFQVGPEHGKHGHVVIRVVGNCVAENSSVHVGGADRNALGFRTLKAFGSYDYIVRLK